MKKSPPSLSSIFFSTPEQKALKLFLSEPTTAFTPRVISSRLKGVRGLGGIEGITQVLGDLKGLGLIDFVDNHRAAKLREDNTLIKLMMTFAAVCDLESLRVLLEPISSKAILFGSRAMGRARSDSDYDLFVVSDTLEEIKKVSSRHPLGRLLELVVWTPEMYSDIERTDPQLLEKLEQGVVLWGLSW